MSIINPNLPIYASIFALIGLTIFVVLEFVKNPNNTSAPSVIGTSETQLNAPAIVVLAAILIFAIPILSQQIAPQANASPETQHLLKQNFELQDVYKDSDGQLSSVSDLRIKFDRMRDQIQEQAHDLDEQATQIAILTSKNNELVRAVAATDHRSDLIEAIKNVGPLSRTAKQIRELQLDHTGPWRTYSQPRFAHLSVAGDMHGMIVRGCNDFYGKTIQLTSRFIFERQHYQGAPSVELEVSQLVAYADTCEEIKPYTLQISCELAVALLSDAVLTCDQRQNPLWKFDFGDANRLIPATALIRVTKATESTIGI